MPISISLIDQIQHNDPNLTEVDLSYCDYTVDDIRNLVEALAANTHAKTLNISGNPIGNTGAQLLAAPHLGLTSLFASGCNISDVSAFVNNHRLIALTLASNEVNEACIALLAKSQTLQSLSLAGNNLQDKDIYVLSDNESLITLILSHNKIGTKGVQAIAQHVSVTTLDLSYNSLQTEGVIALANNPNYKSLALAGTNLAIAGLIALAHQNKTLTHLDVSNNYINNKGVFELAQHPTITELNLSYNAITFEGAHALSSNTHLTSLIINHNLLKDSGAIFLARHKTLRHLDLSGNRVGFEGAYALSLNNILTSLALSSNSLGDAGGVVLAQNKTLTELLLSYNAIKDAGAIALAGNSTLKKLNLNYNMVGDKGRKALKENTTLTTLMLSLEQPPEFSEENLDTIFLLSESFLCICDTNGTLQFFNPSFSRTLGYTQDELLAKSFFKFLHPQDKFAFMQQLQVESQAPIYNYENRYQCKDGSFRTIRWTSHTKDYRIYAIGVDVTEQRRIEKDYIAVQHEALLNSLQEAEAYNLRQMEFISHLSHELRNPLSGFYGLMEVLKEQVKQVEDLLLELRDVTSLPLQDKFTHSFADIACSFRDMIVCAEYQKTILNDNLDIVKIAEKKLQLNNHPFDLKKTLHDVIVMFKTRAHQKGVAIKTEFPIEKEVWVKGDDLRLKQIIVNLLGNAVKFTSSGSVKVFFSISNQIAENLQVNINVIDTGIGLSSQEISQLFQRFSQATSITGSQYNGSGLGLYIAKQLAQAMGGDITVSSEKGIGSTFSVVLPFTVPSLIEAKEHDVEEQKTATVATPSSTPKPFSKRRILVVDDNHINQRILTRILKAAGHESATACNGLEALAAFDQSNFDAIFMDIYMPEMDGLAAAREIRKREATKNLARTPIFAISANALEEDKKKAFEAGMDHYFTKPFKKDEVNQKIADLPVKRRTVKKASLQPKLGMLHVSSAGLLFSYNPRKEEPIKPVQLGNRFR